jgi:exodeoxyribonuclease V beta subunit
VRTNRNASRVRDALEAVDVPAVINGAGSVFGTEPAREWLRVLEAIERPSHPSRARSAALTTILGWTTERVAGASDDEWEEVHRRLHHWARVLRMKGVASLMEAITLEEGLPARVLAMVDGERRMTDLRHVGELLHAAAVADQMGATALTGWLRARVLEAARDNNDEERSRRLDSDAEAVQVLTMHRSKGLEFPVVYYPDLWEPSWIPSESGNPVTFHDADGKRTIDVGLGGPQWKGHVKQNVDEQRGEDLRLAYVALTRAKHQAVVWWAGSFSSRDSALSRLLFARDGEGNVASSGAAVPTDAVATERFRALGDRVSVEPSVLGPTVSWPGDVIATSELSASSFDRALDWSWRRTSFSDITAGTYEARVASEPEEPVVDDESAPHAPPVEDDGAEELRAVPSLLAEMPVGVEVGTLVHRVFESLDFAAADLDAELAAAVAAAQARRRVELGDVDVVVAGLRAAIETPLGPMAGGVALRDVGRADRLDELDFELPLVGGDDPSGPALTLSAIASVLRSHSEPGDPLAGYAERLLDPRLRSSVRGYLAGSIDLVVRLGGDRFAVVDYKTNWLAFPGEELTAWHHRPAALSAEMRHSHYGLQALLYTVALQRYLRWRLPGYSAERNLAGVLYLFVRGMTGPETPVVDGIPCGVFTWQPSAALVEALSDVLDSGASGASAVAARVDSGASA